MHSWYRREIHAAPLPVAAFGKRPYSDLPGNRPGPSALERLSAERRARRLARYEQVVTLRAQGASTRTTLLAHCPGLAAVRELARQFRTMLPTHDANALRPWLAAAHAGKLRPFAVRLAGDFDAVLAAAIFPWSPGQVEGQVHRLPLVVKRAMYGRASFALLQRLSACATPRLALLQPMLRHRFIADRLRIKLPQLAPAGVLFALGGVGVFLALEPEAKPVSIAALRG